MSGEWIKVVASLYLILSRRLLKKASQQGRNERKPEAYSVGYVEGLSDARTRLEGFFNSR